MPTPPDRFSRKRAKSKPPAPDTHVAAPKSPAEPLSNLEMDGDRLKVYSLADLIKHKRGHNRTGRPIATLGDVLVPWFEKAVEKPSEKLGIVADVWPELVPKTLAGSTRLMGLSRGTLTVAADNATVRAELDAALRRGLLRQLQTASKGSVYRVKTSIQPPGIPEVS